MRIGMGALIWAALLAIVREQPVAALGTEASPRAARSVHLWWPAPEAQIAYNELTVEQSQPGTYFCALGFGHGYFGIQQLRGPDDKVVIFSVWDPGNQNDPKMVPEDRQVKVLFQGEDVRVGRFGGEGTGAQSFHRYAWSIGETCRFLVRAKVEGQKTAYAAYFYRNDRKQWKHLATFQTLSGGEPLKGLYSFVEDFRRDGRSPHEVRKARYENGWVKTTAGDWVSLARARFTGDNTPLLNIDAGVTERGFWLATGGQTVNNTKLGSLLQRSPDGLTLPQFED